MRLTQIIMRYILIPFILFITLHLNAQFAKTKTSGETKYYQTFMQVVDSTYYYSWNTSSLVWEITGRDSLVYDTMGILQNRFSFQIDDSDNFIESEHQQNEIVNHEIISTTFSVFDYDEWIPDYKIVNESTTDSTLIYDTIAKQFNYDLIIYSYYNIDNLLDSIIEHQYDTSGSFWVNYSKTAYTYSAGAKNKLVSLWDSVNDRWFENTKYSFHLIDNSNFDTLWIQSYDTANEIWLNEQRIVQTFLNNNKISSVIQFFDGIDSWVNFSKDSIVYSSEGKEEQIIRLYWNQSVNAFENHSRNVYRYNYLGKHFEDIFQVWNMADNNWENYSKTYHYFSNIVCTMAINLTENYAISCYGSNDGEIMLHIEGGAEPYSVEWQNNESTATILQNAEPDKYYTVTVIDAFGCQIKDSVMIAQPDSLYIDTVEIRDVSCNGISDGFIGISVLGGTGEYSFLWNDESESDTDSLFHIPAGQFEVTITDENNCMLTKIIEITEPSAIEVQMIEKSDVSCNGFSDGFIGIAVTGGTGEYSYLWNDENESDTDSLFHIPAGQFEVTITDENNCMLTQIVEISEPPVLGAQIIEKSDVSCNGFSDGYIRIKANGGTAPYIYYWPELEMNDSLVEGLSANGFYHFLVTDVQNCEFIDSVKITQPDSVLTSEIVGFNNVQLDDLVEYFVEPTEGSYYYWSATLGDVKYGNGTNLVLVEWKTMGDGEVSVIEEAANGCFGDTVKYSVVVSQETGINNVNNAAIQIYPNPFSEVLHVVLKNNMVAKSYQIIDLSGKIIRRNDNLSANAFEIDGNELESGMYYLSIMSDKSYIMKIVVE